MRAVIPLLLLSAALASPRRAAVTPTQIRQVLQLVATEKSKTYNCSVSIAFKNAEMQASAAAGVADFSTGRAVTVNDAFAWGSGTKPLTGASILKLVSEGHFTLETPAHQILDPMLLESSKRDPTQKFSCMADLWGAENVSSIVIGQLLNMTSGIPDFDTAKGHGSNSDPLRLELYNNPTKATPCVDRAPHWHKCYSSTNFMLLGLILANNTRWNQFEQSAFLPGRGETLRFAVSGNPSDYQCAHGYDRTAYNMPPGQTNDRDVAGVAGVFAGWTASDLVGSAAEVAALAWEIYGPSPSVIPEEYSKLMVSTALERDYGLATFNLARDTGQSGEYGAAVGHLGATYGYQSQLVYFPKMEFVMTVATNIETDTQTQPKDALCFASNGVVGLLLGQDIKCTFTKSSYYGSGCNCTAIMP